MHGNKLVHKKVGRIFTVKENMTTKEKILMMMVDWLTPSCKVISQKISDSMEAKLSFSDRLKVKVHLMGCKFCERYRKQLLALRGMLENYTEKDADRKLSKESKERIKRRLKDRE